MGKGFLSDYLRKKFQYAYAQCFLDFLFLVAQNHVTESNSRMFGSANDPNFSLEIFINFNSKILNFFAFISKLLRFSLFHIQLLLCS